MSNEVPDLECYHCSGNHKGTECPVRYPLAEKVYMLEYIKARIPGYDDWHARKALEEILEDLQSGKHLKP